jgi:LDH2 family malate/lactate/ureidoglycolate dehydrogenase
MDGQGGVPLLALDRAAGLAVEKAREMGLGLIRVANVGPVGSAAVVAGEVAIGPMAAVLIGPEGAWAIALPSPNGLPMVADPSLADPPARVGKRAAAPARVSPAMDALGPIAAILAPDEGWLVAALSVNAMEPLSSLHDRVAKAIQTLGNGDGLLAPGPWNDRRRSAHTRGLALASGTLRALRVHSERLGIAIPNGED